MLLTTFPRSGSHFLRSSINLNYNIEENIDKSHSMKIRGENEVTIIRNPKDCIPSVVSMNALMHSQLYLPKYDLDLIFTQRIKRICQAYIDFMEFYYENIKKIYPIKFDDLILNPDYEIKKLLNHYNIKYNYKKSSIELEDDYELHFIPSSKNIREYDRIYNLAIPLVENAEQAYNYMIKAIDNKEHIS